jgi:hypothetical protein
MAANARTIAALQMAFQADVNEGIEAVADAPAPTSRHRAQHRPGIPRKIDMDPELRAFIEARIDGMTFHDIAEAVATAFPEPRRVAKSAIHAWWKAQNPRRR